MTKINIDEIILDNESSIKIEDSDGHELNITANGEINVISDQLLDAISPILGSVSYDSGTVQYPNSTTEIYEFRQGGISGNIVATVTLIYTNSTKKDLQSFEGVVI